MKHQTITLVKFKALSARLAMPLWQTVGLLESLWLFAMHNARDGDLSRYQPSEIGAWIEYTGDAENLIEALVATRWLDRVGDELVIHDWADHKPTWLKGVEARQLSSEVSSELSSEVSRPKSGTKQVRVRVIGSGTKDKPFVKGARESHHSPLTPAELPPFSAKHNSPRLRQALGDWLSYKGKPPKPRALKALVTRLEKRAEDHGEDAVVDAVEKAMANGWQGWDQDSSFVGKTANNSSRVVTPEEFAEMTANGFNLATGEYQR